MVSAHRAHGTHPIYGVFPISVVGGGRNIPVTRVSDVVNWERLYLILNARNFAPDDTIPVTRVSDVVKWGRLYLIL